MFLLQVIVDTIKCGRDELECLLDASADDVTRAAPNTWHAKTMTQSDLPVSGEKRDHAWLTVDKFVLYENPVEHWRKHGVIDSVPIVFGTK